jgi:hypothetical protein
MLNRIFSNLYVFSLHPAFGSRFILFRAAQILIFGYKKSPAFGRG